MTLSDLFLEKSAPAEPGASEALLYTLLFVDDEPPILEALKRVFGRRSYRILTANSGAEALQIMEQETVHLVISDHRMPRMSGADLLTTIRGQWPDTIRIMLTGYADIQSIMSAVKEGSVFKFITKPWQDDNLRVTVARALEQYQLQLDIRKLLSSGRDQEELQLLSSRHFRQDRGMLVKILLRMNKITPEEYSVLVQDERGDTSSMYRMVRERTELSEQVICSALEKALSLQLIDLRECRVSAEAASLLPPDCCLENLLLPIRLQGSELTVAMADPSDIFKRDSLEGLTGFRVTTVLCPGSDLEQKVREVYGPLAQTEDGEYFDPMDDIDIVIEGTEELNVQELIASSVIAPVVRIVNSLVSEAVARGASDLHITPQVKYTSVRYRIDGLLQERVRLPAEVHAAVSSRIKVLAKMDIAERRRPQDGRMTVRVSDRVMDVRVSSVPSLYGENMVLRVLDRATTVHRLDDLGLAGRNLERARVIGKRPQGIFLCTGPTGSGKTTLLYSLLRENLSADRNYATIEDPVEYYIEEATQISVCEKAGLTFPRVLKAMMRQDPDVLLIGEMRDPETAGIAFKAALTGHLVLSTLHTVSAVETVTRLVDLGVQPYLVATALNGAIAQRLVRRVCRRCRRLTEPDPTTLRLLGLRADEVPEAYVGAGCSTCGGTGYHGRMGVFELLEVTDEIRDLILDGAPNSRIAETARENGMRSLFQDALVKVGRGETTLDEVMRVLGPRPILFQDCPRCDTRVVVSGRCCTQCGEVFVALCGGCGKRMKSGWNFCIDCGHPQATSCGQQAASQEKIGEGR